MTFLSIGVAGSGRFNLMACPQMPEFMTKAELSAPYLVERIETAKAFLEHIRRLDDGACRTAFQKPVFIGALLENYVKDRDVTPILLRVAEPLSGETVLLLPLVQRWENGLSVIEFADLGVADYNAPILTEKAPRDPVRCRQLWSEVRKALPKADLIRFVKMPDQIDTCENPLIRIGTVNRCKLYGQRFDTGGDWDGYIRRVNPKFGKDTRRRRRRLEERGQVHFRQITELAEVEQHMDLFDEMQKMRLDEAGRCHDLDDPVLTRFYRRLLAADGQTGEVKLFSLSVGDEIVALLYGIANGDEFSILRITHAGADWNNASPGRLIIVETVCALEQLGFRVFDLTIGDYFFKHLFRPQIYPLYSLIEGRSLKGRLCVAFNRAKDMLRIVRNRVRGLIVQTVEAGAE